MIRCQPERWRRDERTAGGHRPADVYKNEGKGVVGGNGFGGEPTERPCPHESPWLRHRGGKEAVTHDSSDTERSLISGTVGESPSVTPERGPIVPPI